jgi:hypothetical protein
MVPRTTNSEPHLFSWIWSPDQTIGIKAFSTKYCFVLENTMGALSLTIKSGIAKIYVRKRRGPFFGGKDHLSLIEITAESNQSDQNVQNSY